MPSARASLLLLSLLRCRHVAADILMLQRAGSADAATTLMRLYILRAAMCCFDMPCAICRLRHFSPRHGAHAAADIERYEGP